MTMRSVSILFASTLLSTSAMIAPAILTPAAAQIDLNINLGPPPAPQYELVPAARPGYAWAPGYWQVENNQHIWAPGRWMEARQDQHWVPDRWESYREGNQEKWRHQPGRWDHDGARAVNQAGRADHDDHRGPNQSGHVEPPHVDRDDHRGQTHDDHRGQAHDDHHGQAPDGHPRDDHEGRH